MKKTLGILGGLILLGAAFGPAFGGPRAVKLTQIARVPTNATPSVVAATSTNSSPVGVYVRGLYLDFGGYASPTVDVDVVVVGAVGTKERTIYSADSVTSDRELFPVESADTTAGASYASTNVVPIAIFPGDKTVVRAYDANVTNVITLDTWLYVDE